MIHPIEFFNTPAPEVVHLVVCYQNGNRLRLATPDDLRAAGYVKATLYAAENEADPKGALRATVDNCRREWDRMVAERDAAESRAVIAEQAREILEQAARELESALSESREDAHRNAHAGVAWANVAKERDAALKRVAELEKDRDSWRGSYNDELGRGINERDDLRTKLEELEGLNAEALNRADDLQLKLTAAEQRAEAYNKRIQELSDTIVAQQKDLDAAEKRAEAAERTAEAMLAPPVTAKDLFAQAAAPPVAADLATLRDRIEKLEAAVERLSKGEAVYGPRHDSAIFANHD